MKILTKKSQQGHSSETYQKGERGRDDALNSLPHLNLFSRLWVWWVHFSIRYLGEGLDKPIPCKECGRLFKSHYVYHYFDVDPFAFQSLCDSCLEQKQKQESKPKIHPTSI